MARKKQWDWRTGLVGKSKRRTSPFPTLSDIQLEHIQLVLQAYDENFVHAAQALGISRATLYRRMNREMSSSKSAAAGRKRRKSRTSA